MEVKQLYELVNDATKEITGASDIIKEDLQGVVELGDAILNANALDKYVKSLVNHIGKVIFVNRKYKGGVPSVLMDAWEFGSVLEKVTVELPDAEENESWELEDRASYDPNIFYKPKVTAKFFNKLTTFEVPVSITEKQVKQSFSNATQLNAFVSMIYNAVEKSMTVKTEALIMRTMNNFIGETVYDAYGSGSQTTSSKVRAINLLYLYNQKFGLNLTADVCLSTPEFLRFASLTMKLYIKRMSRMSTLFNIGGKDRFTPNDLLHVVLLTDFVTASDVYLQSDTFHKDLVALPNYEDVPFWQGSGTEFAFADISKIDITTSSGNDVTVSGILGVMFDRDALGVCNTNRRTTTNYNAKAEFFNNYYKHDAEFFNDLNENFIVFFAA